MRHLTLDHFERTALERVETRVVQSCRGGGVQQRPDFGGHGADRVVFLLEHLRDIAFARLRHAWEQLALFEIEMARDVLFDEAGEPGREFHELGVARSPLAGEPRERRLDAAQQVQVAAMFSVQLMADLSGSAHRQSQIMVLKYQNSPRNADGR